MKKYLLETSVIIEYLRGNKEWVKKIDELEGETVSSYVCLAELYEGIARDTKGGARKKVLGLFKSLSYVYPVDGGVAEAFGKLRAELKKSGRVIEDMDLLVAATCLVTGSILVTENKKHFERVAGLEIL